jgi:hypothetical protein
MGGDHKDSASAQRCRIQGLVAELIPNAEVVFDQDAGSMIRYRIDDRPSGKVVAISGYDVPSVIADWSDVDLRERIRALVAGRT